MDVAHADNLDEEAIRNGFNSTLPNWNSAGHSVRKAVSAERGGGGFLAARARWNEPGPAGGRQDEGKPLISNYCRFRNGVRAISGTSAHGENWLDCNNLGRLQNSTTR